jgi:hypothetical protein
MYWSFGLVGTPKSGRIPYTGTVSKSTLKDLVNIYPGPVKWEPPRESEPI